MRVESESVCIICIQEENFYEYSCLFVLLAGIGAWHVTGDRSNAGGVVGSVAGAPGTTDEVFLAAQEAAQAHRDSQGRLIHIIFYLLLLAVTIGTRVWQKFFFSFFFFLFFFSPPPFFFSFFFFSSFFPPHLFSFPFSFLLKFAYRCKGKRLKYLNLVYNWLNEIRRNKEIYILYIA